MSAELLSEGGLEQMRRGMVAGSGFPCLDIDLGLDLIADRNAVAVNYPADVQYIAVSGLARCGDLKEGASVLITPVSPAWPPLSP